MTSALKLVHGKAGQIKKAKKCFKSLGSVYLEYGKKYKNGEDFAKAVALYNAALCRLQDEEIQQKETLILLIKETEKQFLKNVLSTNSKIEVPAFENDLQHKALLTKIREHCKRVLCNIDSNSGFEIKLLHPDKRVPSERERTTLVRSLFRDIADGMCDVVRTLLEECKSMLGSAPCCYAVIGLGSLSRQEMTPYSDLEFAFLIEEGKNTEKNIAYFRHLTHYLHIKVINLGETILPSMGIVSLNDFYSKDESRKWFYDDGPRGFCFDAAMPWASKMPLGRKKTEHKDALELIKTPTEMAALQSEQIAIKEGYHLADVMVSSLLIAGDEELFQEYEMKIKENLQTPSKCGNSWTNGSRRGFFSLHEALHNFDMNIDSNEEGKAFNVKKDLYRFPSLIVSSLSLYFNLNTRVPWNAVKEMNEKNLINNEEAHNLQFALAIASEFRLRSYLANKSQRERVTTLMSDVVEAKVNITLTGQVEKLKMDEVIHLSNTDVITRFFMTVLPLQKAVRTLLLNESSRRRRKFTTENNLFDERFVLKFLSFKLKPRIVQRFLCTGCSKLEVSAKSSHILSSLEIKINSNVE